jgi:hypothetical protein
LQLCTAKLAAQLGAGVLGAEMCMYAVAAASVIYGVVWPATQLTVGPTGHGVQLSWHGHQQVSASKALINSVDQSCGVSPATAGTR